MVTVLRVPSLVVTLAALYIIRGIDGVIVNGVTINPSSIPTSFQKVGYQTLLGVPWMAIIVAVVVVVVGYAMRSYRSAVSSTPSGPIRTPRRSPASRPNGGCSPRSW